MSFYNRHRHQNAGNYLALLLAFIALIIFPAVGGMFNMRTMTVFYIVYATVIVIGVFTATSTPRELIIGTLLGGLTLATALGRYSLNVGLEPFSIAELIIGTLFWGFLGYSILHNLLLRNRVDAQTIFGSVIGYFILGCIGGQFCLMIDALAPGSFSNVEVHSSGYQYYYYSYVTLTTLGYGDIAPTNDPARAISLIIAIIGQIYLTIVLALIVGKYIVQSEREERNRAE